MPKSLSKVSSFLMEKRLASFATADDKGQPHIVPVFFTYDEGKVYVQTDLKSVKVRNLTKNSNAAVAVYQGEEAVIIRGKGKVVKDRNEFIKRTQEHIDKYGLQIDQHGRDSMGIPLFNAEVRCIIEMTPDRILFW